MQIFTVHLTMCQTLGTWDNKTKIPALKELKTLLGETDKTGNLTNR